MCDTNAILAELNTVMIELTNAKSMVAKQQQTLYGRLPFVRSRLQDVHRKLDDQRHQIDLATQYMLDLNK